MTDSVYNDMHINAVLVMLPYDAAKVASYPLGLMVNGEPAAKRDLSSKDHIQSNFPLGTTVSFLNADKQRVYYKLIADSDASVKPGNYARSHDAAAYVEVDAKGNEVTNSKTGKPNVVVTFPGLNNPIINSRNDVTDALQDSTKENTFQEKFFDAFIDLLQPELTKRGMSFVDTKVIGHSMGDKHAAEYAMRYHVPGTMIIDGWDKKDAVTWAAMREVLRENQGKSLTETTFRAAFTNKVAQLVGDIVEIDPAGKQGTIGGTAYEIIGAGHFAKEYMFKTPQTVVRKEGLHNVAPLINERFELSGVYEKTPEMIEYNFFICVENNFRANGKTIDANQEKILADLWNKLSASGVQIDVMQDAAAKYLFKPVAKKDIAPTIPH